MLYIRPVHIIRMYEGIQITELELYCSLNIIFPGNPAHCSDDVNSMFQTALMAVCHFKYK